MSLHLLLIAIFLVLLIDSDLIVITISVLNVLPAPIVEKVEGAKITDVLGILFFGPVSLTKTARNIAYFYAQIEENVKLLVEVKTIVPLQWYVNLVGVGL